MKVSKKTIFSLAFAAALTAGATAAHAQMLTDLGTTNVTGQTINLNASSAFAAYNGAQGSGYGVRFTDTANAGSFTNLTTGSGTKGVGTDSQIFTTASNSSGTVTASQGFSYTQGTQTLTTTLFGPTQTFNIYVSQYQATSTFTFSLATSGGTNLATLTLTGLSFYTTDGSHYYGEESIRVQGAVGNVLTISQGVTSGNNVGINAITTSVPEPGTWTMIAGGLGTLAGCQCLRRRTVR